MKISAAQFDGFVAVPPLELRGALIYGENEGLVRDRSAALGKTVVPDLRDPFLVCNLTSTEKYDFALCDQMWGPVIEKG